MFMPTRRELLEFVIDAYSPETLPMSRLAEYMAELATLLGEKEHVHFVELAPGSARLVHAVEYEASPKVRSRLHAARVGDGDPEARRALDTLDHMLRDDNASGELREPHGAKLLTFPGNTKQLDEEYGPFNEEGQLYGIPIMVGGKKRIVPVHIQDGETVHNCEASREVASDLAGCLFKSPVRAFGVGRHIRNADGQWEMRSFRISHFEKLDARPLAETIERLRGISRKIGLDRDIVSKLTKLRHDPSEAWPGCLT
jgi:hypothetical protein